MDVEGALAAAPMDVEGALAAAPMDVEGAHAAAPMDVEGGLGLGLGWLGGWWRRARRFGPHLRSILGPAALRGST